MKFSAYVLIVLLALGAGYAGSQLGVKSANTPVAHESVYDRVMKSGVIRCGYGQWPPLLVKDANTGKITGMAADILEEMARNLKLKVEWAEETGWGSFAEALSANRIDMFCNALWQNAERSRVVYFTRPFAYSASHAYGRVDDARFDEDLSLLNDAQYKIAVMGGEMSSTIARNFFPKANTLSLSQMSSGAELVLAVQDGKADITFLEPSFAKEYADKNPGKVRQITKQPFSVFPNGFALKSGEDQFKAMIDGALGEMINQGRVEKIMRSYIPDPGVMMSVAKPYTYVDPQPLK